jgi:hypothetical protein
MIKGITTSPIGPLKRSAVYIYYSGRFDDEMGDGRS